MAILVKKKKIPSLIPHRSHSKSLMTLSIPHRRQNLASPSPNPASPSPKPSLTVLTLPLPIHFARFSSQRFSLPAIRDALVLRTICDASGDALILPATLQSIHQYFFFFTDEIDFFIKFLLREELLKVICLWVLVSLLSFDSLLMFEFIFTYSNYWCGSSSFGLFH